MAANGVLFLLSTQYLVDLCQSVSSVASRHLRCASRGLLVMPRRRLSSYGRRAFSVAGLVSCDMELVIRQSERSGHQQRLLQAFTEDVFIFSSLVYIAH